ncbi:MAG: hypothetical protein HKN92_09660 [Chitinophagales bacterium]|nr:hypothetical protein [Chitinophagales bacterium]
MITRKLEEARKAFRNKDVDASIAAHDIEMEQHERGGQYIKSLVYGGLDGIITTFAIVAGVAGASLSSGVILVLGFANLIADGLSMAIGDYLSTKAENDYTKTERAREEWEVDVNPEGEKEEIRLIYENKGVSKEDSKQISEIISKYKNVWVDTMMVEELGLFNEEESPVKNALVTFFSFIVFGFIPLSIYILAIFITDITHTFYYASALTGVTLFILGAFKGKVTGSSVIKSGFEMMIVGGIAAISAYAIGHLLSGFANN